MLAADDVATFEADGFVTVDSLIDPDLIEPLRERFERLFRGEFETRIAPDEVNWLDGRDERIMTATLRACARTRASTKVTSDEGRAATEPSAVGG